MHRVVHSTELLHTLGDHALGIGFLRDIGFDQCCGNGRVEGCEFRSDGFEAAEVEIREDQARAAFFDEGLGCRAADPRGGACY